MNIKHYYLLNKCINCETNANAIITMTKSIILMDRSQSWVMNTVQKGEKLTFISSNDAISKLVISSKISILSLVQWQTI